MTIEELLRDEALVKQIEEAESVEAVEKLMAERGLTVTAQELAKEMEAFGDGEMSEDSLDTVAGGIQTLRPNDPIFNAGRLLGRALKKLFGRK